MKFESGYFYHVYNRGNNLQKTFFNRENYLLFLRKMKKHLSPYVSIVAWCLMPTHFHWVIFVHQNKINIMGGHAMISRHSMTKGAKDTEESQESHTMAQSHSMTGKPTKTRTLNYSIGILLRSYTRAIQQQQNIVGSLFQQHTEAKILIDEIEITPAYWNTAFGTLINIADNKSYLETCIEYVHQNPVCAGLVANAEDWEFSSMRDFLGLRHGQLIDYELLEREKLLPEERILTRLPNLSRETSRSNICIIAIGSNLEAEKNIPAMLDILKTHVEVLRVSSFIITKPVGMTNQPDFTNGAVRVQTELDQKQLKSLLKSIEDKMGRDRSGPKFGPRTMDLDIVMWNGEIVDDDYYTRDFIRKSVQEIL